MDVLLNCSAGSSIRRTGEPRMSEGMAKPMKVVRRNGETEVASCWSSEGMAKPKHEVQTQWNLFGIVGVYVRSSYRTESTSVKAIGE